MGALIEDDHLFFGLIAFFLYDFRNHLFYTIEVMSDFILFLDRSPLKELQGLAKLPAMI